MTQRNKALALLVGVDMKLLITSSLTLAVLLSLASTASAGDFSARLGFGSFNPKSDNGVIAGANSEVSSETGVFIGASYYLNDQWELTLDMPVSALEHQVNLAGLGDVVSLEQRATILGVNYRFMAGESFSPYLGLGYAMVGVSNVRGIGALAGAPLQVDDSDSFSFALGGDYMINDQWSIRGEARYIDFESDVSLAGGNVGTASVDPWQITVFAGFRF